MHYYIGTNKGSDGDGIYQVTLADGKLTGLKKLVDLIKPSWLHLDKARGLLFATETYGNKTDPDKSGSVCSLKIKDAALELISKQPSAGPHPCYLWSTQTHVMTANYGNGSVAHFSIADDGSLSDRQVFQHQGTSVDAKRQKGPHAHQIIADGSNTFAYSCDLGADKIFIYQVHETGLKSHGDYAIKVPGGGPRHMVFHPSKPYAYVVYEMTGVLEVMRWDAVSGALSHVGLLELPGEATSDLRWAGQYLYAGLRSNNQIAIIDCFHEAEPQLVETVAVGGRPRGFSVSDDGHAFLCGNEKEDRLELFERNSKNGLIGKRLDSVEILAPVCVCSAALGHQAAVHGIK